MMNILSSVLFLLGLFIIPMALYFDMPGWVAISYSILIGARIIVEEITRSFYKRVNDES